MAGSRKVESKTDPRFDGPQAIHASDFNFAADWSGADGESVTVPVAESAPTLSTDGKDARSKLYLVWTCDTFTTATYAVRPYCYNATTDKWSKLLRDDGTVIEWSGFTEALGMGPIPIAGFDRIAFIVYSLAGLAGTFKKSWKLC